MREETGRRRVLDPNQRDDCLPRTYLVRSMDRRVSSILNASSHQNKKGRVASNLAPRLQPDERKHRTLLDDAGATFALSFRINILVDTVNVRCLCNCVALAVWYRVQFGVQNHLPTLNFQGGVPCAVRWLCSLRCLLFRYILEGVGVAWVFVLVVGRWMMTKRILLRGESRGRPPCLFLPLAFALPPSFSLGRWVSSKRTAASDLGRGLRRRQGSAGVRRDEILF